MKFPANSRTWISIAVSVVSLAGVVWWASNQQAPRFPTDLDHLALVVAAIGVYAVATLARSWRWSALLGYAGIDHSKADVYSLIPVTYMGNTVLPARGGDVLRVILLHDRVAARRRDILATVVTERALDAVSLAVLFVVITIVGVANQPLGVKPALITVAALILLGGGALGFITMRRRGFFKRLTIVISPLAASIRPLIGTPGVTLSAVTTSIWFLEGIVLWLVGMSLSLHFAVIDGFFLLILAAFSSLIPTGPGFIGTFDSALVFGLKALSINKQAFAFVLLARFVLFVPITIVGIILLVVRFGGIKQLRRRKKQDIPENQMQSPNAEPIILASQKSETQSKKPIIESTTTAN